MVSNISKKVQAENAPPPDLRTGLTDAERAAMEQARQLAEAEKALEASRLPAAMAEDPDLILQEIQIDVFNKARRYVRLTPSMCPVKTCGYDAAKEMNSAGWEAAPINQTMPDGKTYGDKLIEMRQYHQATAHVQNQTNDHIIKQSELNKRAWNVGGARTDFQTAK